MGSGAQLRHLKKIPHGFGLLKYFTLLKKDLKASEKHANCLKTLHGKFRQFASAIQMSAKKIKKPLPMRLHLVGEDLPFALSDTRWQARGLCSSYKQGVVIWKRGDCRIPIGWRTAQLQFLQILGMHRLMTLENFDGIFYFEPLSLPS